MGTRYARLRESLLSQIAILCRVPLTSLLSHRFDPTRQLTAATDRPHMSSRDTKQANAGLSILVAEDSVVHQTIAVRLLENLGHAVTVVGNGKEAVRALRRGVFDVLLTDVEMPELDGLSTARMIRAAEVRLGGRLPIVGVTTNDNHEDCLNAGMDAYLPKPLEAESLTRTLQKVVRKMAA